MSHQIEQTLIKRSDADPHLRVLRAQWDFDKTLLSSALQTIGNTFPHYSRHDASHSHSILVQVERFLGPDAICKLSGTDAWLLLEAAYHHDAGMIVTNSQLEGMWLNAGFRSYLHDLRSGADEDLAEAAGWLVQNLHTDSPDAAPRMDERWPLRVVSAVRIVVAEHRRREHAARSADVVAEPADIGLASPRTGLIPERLFRTLGQVCSAHGQTFEETMLLPRCEAGVSTDEAHPRFIACLLRLGDLLDLDNGRFCPTMLAFAGGLPRSSNAHVLKHAAIRHLEVTPQQIAVQAECSSEDAVAGGYETCALWLDMLQSELAAQQGSWTTIAPSGFGPLPSPGRIEVKLRNALSLGRLEVDSEKVTKLLQGFNLYKDTSTFVRELLQNAVDATLLRTWYEHGDAIAKAPSEADKLTHAQSLLQSSLIDVSFSRTDRRRDGKQLWHLTVRDSGIGISRNDVVFMQKIGSSSKNQDKRELVRSMPEWLRPSGIFGVGIQSLFLVTDEVTLTSRSIITGEKLKVRLMNGKAALNPSLLLESLGDAVRQPFGTSVECDIPLESLPVQFSWSWGDTK